MAKELERSFVGGNVVRKEPRCNVCNSPAKGTIDKLLAAGFSNTSVAQELMERDEAFANKEFDTVRRNIERHSKNHLDIRNRAVREIVERRAKEAGILTDSAIGTIVSGRALLDLIINKATEQAVDPNSKVKYADAIEAVKMLEDVQKSEYVHQLEILQRQVWAISTAVKELIAPDQLPKFVDRARELFEEPTLELERNK